MNKQEFTISGTWEPVDDFSSLFQPRTQTVTLILKNRRLFGVDWYPERLTFEAEIAFAQQASDGCESEVSGDIRPKSQVLCEKSEWWRRAIYQVVRWVPTLKPLGSGDGNHIGTSE